VLLIWLYVLAIAVLIGAALNAAIEVLWPRREFHEAREAVKSREVLMKRPGLDTGEIDLPLNRPPAELKRPEGKSAGPLG
jgi:membrane protein